MGTQADKVQKNLKRAMALIEELQNDKIIVHKKIKKVVLIGVEKAVTKQRVKHEQALQDATDALKKDQRAELNRIRLEVSETKGPVQFLVDSLHICLMTVIFELN